MKFIANTFLKGLILIVPLLVTFGLLYWLLVTGEELFSIPLQLMLPAGWYIPGMGVVFAIVVVFAFGVLAQAFLFNHLFDAIEKLVGRIPLVKTLYGSARDLLNFVVGSKGREMQKVVTVTFDGDIKLIGFVTNEDVSLGNEKDMVAVYLPLSYQIGGYLLYLPKSRLEPLDIPVQQAMQQVLTAHIKREPQPDSHELTDSGKDTT